MNVSELGVLDHLNINNLFINTYNKKILEDYQESSRTPLYVMHINPDNLCRFFPPTLPCIVNAILKPHETISLELSHRDTLDNLYHFIKKGIRLYMDGVQVPLKDLLKVLLKREDHLLSECLNRVLKDHNLTPINKFSFAEVILNSEYEHLKYVHPNSIPRKPLAINQLPVLQNELVPIEISKSEWPWLLYLIFEHEALVSTEIPCLGDQILPLFTKIDPPPLELLFLQSKQKIRSGQIEEGQKLALEYFKRKKLTNPTPNRIDLTKQQYSLNEELFLGLFLDGKDLLSVYKKFQSQIADLKPSLRSPLDKSQFSVADVKMFIRCTLGAAMTQLKLRKIDEAKKLCNEITVNIDDSLISQDVRKFIQDVNERPIELRMNPQNWLSLLL